MQTSPGRRIGKRRLDLSQYSGWLFFIPTAILLYLIMLRPIVIGAVYSLYDLNGFTPEEFVGLKNYESVLTNSDFIKTLGNTLKYCGWSFVIGFPLPIIVAIMLNEIVHFKNTMKTALYLPVILPGIAAFMIWQQLYQPGDAGVLNLVTSIFGMEPSEWLQNPTLTIILLTVVSTWKTFGSTVLMYLAVVQGVNQELYEAANIDGANIWNKFRYILMPQMYPMMLLLAVRQFIGVFQTFEIVLTMTGGGPNNASMTLGLMTYNYGFVNFQFDKALAMGFVTFLMLSILTVIYFVLDKKVSEGV